MKRPWVPLFQLKEVSFSNSTITPSLQSDDGSLTYDAPHWQDSNSDGDADDSGERKYPIAYVGGTPPTMESKITVKPTGLTSVSGFVAKIKATGPGDVAVPATTAQLGTDELQLSATPSSGNFVSEVDYLNPMTLSWQVEVKNSGHWCDAGQTENRAYVTLGVPLTSMRQETVFNIGCRNADGMTTPADAATKIWEEFTDRSVKKIDPTTEQPTGTQMTYYASYNPIDANGDSVITTQQLLKANDGQCGAWVSLLIRCRQALGFDDPNDYLSFGPINENEGFAVNHWNFAQTETSGNPTYPYLNICPLVGSVVENLRAARGFNSYNWAYAEVTDGNGVDGQGTTNPASLFGEHVVMTISGQIYDPSYGVTHGSLAEFENNAVARYYLPTVLNLDEATYGLDLNANGNQTDTDVLTACYLFRKNLSGNELETKQQSNY